MREAMKSNFRMRDDFFFFLNHSWFYLIFFTFFFYKLPQITSGVFFIIYNNKYLPDINRATRDTVTHAIEISSVLDLTTVNSISMRYFYFPTCCGRSCISFRTIMERTDSQLWNSFSLDLKLPEFHDIQTCRKFTFSPPGIWEWRITVVVVGKSIFTVIIITCLTSNGLY